MTSRTPDHRWYALTVLTLTYGVSLLDRGLMVMLLEPIGNDLSLNDTELGFLSGIAFAAFYATIGIPMGRLSDTHRRAPIVAAAMAVWSLTTAACMFVTTFGHLVAARIVAAIGDAGCKPPIYSLLGDYFPRPVERTRALYIHEASVPVASLVSFAAAGWLNEHFGWRLTMLMIGAPGFLLAILIAVTLREPARTGRSARAHTNVGAVASSLWRQHSSRNLLAAMTLTFVVGIGMGAWQVAFLMRQHNLGSAEIGLWLGLVYGIGGLAGLGFGAWVLERYFPNRPRMHMRLAAAAASAMTPCYLTFLFAPTGTAAIAVLAPQAILFNAFLPAAFAVLQRLTPNEARATALMFVLLCANLIGMGLGPQIVGIASDHLSSLGRADGLRGAMFALSFVGLWAGFHFWRLSVHVERDIQINEQDAVAAAASSPP